MSKFLTRFLLVLTGLAAPSFLGGSLVFQPFVTLYIWGANAMKYHNPDIGPADTQTLALTVAWMLAVPFVFALWFGLVDILRVDIRPVVPRSKAVLNILIATFSWLVMFVALAYSNAHAGPIFYWGAGDMLFPVDPTGAIGLTALGLLGIELFTAWFYLARRS